MMGMWSEDSPVMVYQVVIVARSGVHRVRSGEVGAWSILRGSRVGLSGSFNMISWSRESIIVCPLLSAVWLSSQRGLWALRSPVMMVCVKLFRGSRCGVYCAGQASLGGMYKL